MVSNIGSHKPFLCFLAICFKIRNIYFQAMRCIDSDTDWHDRHRLMELSLFRNTASHIIYL